MIIQANGRRKEVSRRAFELLPLEASECEERLEAAVWCGLVSWT